MLPDAALKDPELFASLVAVYEVHRLLLTPTLLDVLLSVVASRAALSLLTSITLCGELPTRALIERTIRLLPPSVELINLFSSCDPCRACDLLAQRAPARAATEWQSVGGFAVGDLGSARGTRTSALALTAPRAALKDRRPSEARRERRVGARCKRERGRSRLNRQVLYQVHSIRLISGRIRLICNSSPPSPISASYQAISG